LDAVATRSFHLCIHLPVHPPSICCMAKLADKVAHDPGMGKDDKKKKRIPKKNSPQSVPSLQDERRLVCSLQRTPLNPPQEDASVGHNESQI